MRHSRKADTAATWGRFSDSPLVLARVAHLSHTSLIHYLRYRTVQDKYFCNQGSRRRKPKFSFAYHLNHLKFRPLNPLKSRSKFLDQIKLSFTGTSDKLVNLFIKSRLSTQERPPCVELQLLKLAKKSQIYFLNLEAKKQFLSSIKTVRLLYDF